MNAIVNIIGHTPVWVFPLIVAVLWLGSINLRERTVPLRSLFIFPLVMLVLSIGNSTGTTASPLVALVDWLFSAAIGAVIGWHLTQRPRAIEPKSGQISRQRDSALRLHRARRAAVRVRLSLWPLSRSARRQQLCAGLDYRRRLARRCHDRPLWPSLPVVLASIVK